MTASSRTGEPCTETAARSASTGSPIRQADQEADQKAERQAVEQNRRGSPPGGTGSPQQGQAVMSPRGAPPTPVETGLDCFRRPETGFGTGISFVQWKGG